MSASYLVPAGSAAALICDTGALLDYLVESAPDHRRFRNAINQARTRYVPALVLAEVDYVLRNECRAMQALMQDVARAPSPTRHPRWISLRAPWRSIDTTRIWASASWTDPSWRLRRRLASVA